MHIGMGKAKARIYFQKLVILVHAYSLSADCSSMISDLGHQGTVEVAEEEAGQGGEGTGQGGGRISRRRRRRRRRRSNNRSM